MDDVSALTAPALFAQAHSRVCAGPDSCYWCGAPCPKILAHDDPRPPVRATPNPFAKRPGNSYQCIGCWLFGKPKTTVFWLSGDFKDSQTASKHSWWITASGAWGIRIPEDSAALYKALLRPPLRFVLSLLDGDNPGPNRLHTALANDHPEIKASTPLTFTVNGVPFCYTVYELEEALTNPGDAAGLLPGVRELLRILGPYKALEAPKVKKERGRPAGSETLPNKNKKLVTVGASASGFPTAPALTVG